jgi:putative ABC transport system substrate-binding protein
MKNVKTILFVITMVILILPGAAYAQDDESYTVGVYTVGDGEDFGFKAAMAELGYVEGENVTYLVVPYVNTSEDMTDAEFAEQLPLAKQAMIDANPDVIAANTDGDALEFVAMGAEDIPIVFLRSDDPVASGAVEDLNNPGGNLTGVVTSRPHEGRLQLLTEIIPTTDTVLYLYIPESGEDLVLEQTQAVADELGVEMIPASVTDEESVLAALEEAPDEVDWVFVTPLSFYIVGEDTLALALERGIAMAGVANIPEFGYLMSYGPSLPATEEQAAQIVDHVLRGASPADMPVQPADNFLAINLDQAEILGIEIPRGILRQADAISRPGDFDEPEG